MEKDEPVQDGLKEMEEVLKRTEIGRIALCDGSVPYMVPLNFIYHEGKIAFHCSLEGKKLNLIAKNPNCCFEVDEFMGKVSDHYATRCHLDYDSVLAFGKARIERNEEERIRLLQLFGEKYDERYRRPVPDGGLKIGKNKPIDNCYCVVIDVEELTGRRERTPDGKRQKTMWHHKF
jgi:nitroimidazol reductase NimA-like FMN-containing flavoprotein (pyridoxamine 5'-phosphate oxidase superfamily)